MNEDKKMRSIWKKSILLVFTIFVLIFPLSFAYAGSDTSSDSQGGSTSEYGDPGFVIVLRNELDDPIVLTDKENNDTGELLYQEGKWIYSDYNGNKNSSNEVSLFRLLLPDGWRDEWVTEDSEKHLIINRVQICFSTLDNNTTLVSRWIDSSFIQDWDIIESLLLSSTVDNEPTMTPVPIIVLNTPTADMSPVENVTLLADRVSNWAKPYIFGDLIVKTLILIVLCVGVLFLSAKKSGDKKLAEIISEIRSLFQSLLVTLKDQTSKSNTREYLSALDSCANGINQCVASLNKGITISVRKPDPPPPPPPSWKNLIDCVNSLVGDMKYEEWISLIRNQGYLLSGIIQSPDLSNKFESHEFSIRSNIALITFIDNNNKEEYFVIPSFNDKKLQSNEVRRFYTIIDNEVSSGGQTKPYRIIKPAILLSKDKTYYDLESMGEIVTF